MGKETLLRDILFDLSKTSDSDSRKIAILGPVFYLLSPEMTEESLRFYLQLSGIDPNNEFVRECISLCVGSKMITVTDRYEDSIVDEDSYAHFFGEYDPDVEGQVATMKASAEELRKDIDLE